MRSMATPIDQNDMMNSTTATPQATAPICSNMSIRSRPPPSCANAGVLSASIPSPAYATCRIFRTFHYCILRKVLSGYLVV